MTEQKTEEKILIKKDMTLGEVVQKFGMPVVEVMGKYGLHCIGCHVATWETIEQGAKAHGLDDKTLTKMVDELNKAAQTAEKQEK
jgi:hybrid cluster-associated redox disulfide protein